MKKTIIFFLLFCNALFAETKTLKDDKNKYSIDYIDNTILQITVFTENKNTITFYAPLTEEFKIQDVNKITPTEIKQLISNQYFINNSAITSAIKEENKIIRNY